MQIRFYFPVLCLVALATFLLSACTSSKLRVGNELSLSQTQLLDDEVFPEYHLYQIESTNEIFFLDESARIFVDTAIAKGRTEKEQVEQLIGAIFARTDLDLVYQEAANTTADTTFTSAAANCLSLSIMTYAMAEYAGFDSDFQLVHIPEYWTRRDGYSLLNGHINLKIVPRANAGITQFFENRMVIDFDTEISSKRFPASKVTKNYVVAMFYNNKGTDALLERNYTKAYRYFKAAIQSNEYYEGSWVNLGYLYRLMGKVELAEQSYLRAIELDDNHLTAWENLAILYRKIGDVKSANSIQSYIKSKRQSNPFYHLMLGEIERDKGDYTASIKHFQEAIRLDENQHQFYFSLATSFFEMGDLDSAKRYMLLAKRKAPASQVAETYSSKVSAIRAIQAK
ncbi:tetratricopeptide repeat protein [Glaciecola sp. MH2013]|uniref:tetratricopeptide repeat protein n=1 Tax=Glaciecola sp. MH2013 TaxID=2785524 RepID=UPI0018A0FDB9|nr:tetratricopeptide repeat protein [Glaciecola sp. MH2013]MBF7071967.1 tetratricopeptide repeat protein [Glaciecola sp. MH2013]